MPADPNDLTTVDELHAWLAPLTSTSDDAMIQLAVTWASRIFCYRTGQIPGVGGIGNTFNSAIAFSEIYDGSGNERQYLKNRPIQSVSSLVCSGVTIPQSTAYGIPGWYIEQDQNSLGMRSGGNANFVTASYTPLLSGYYFPKGMGNIAVSYTAGYGTIPADVQMAVTHMASILYKRRGWLGERSRSMAGGGGTTAFTTVPWPREVELVMLQYGRLAVV